MTFGKWHNNLSFQIGIPVFLVLGLLAIPVIISSRWRMPVWLLVGVGIFVICWLVNVPSTKEYWDEFGALLGCVTIPFAVALLREKKVFDQL